ncbi:MAG: helix-turn-helix protein [Spirosoma sp.]|nr:helix-turn-helix protein [Spirosoma sp.]
MGDVRPIADFAGEPDEVRHHPRPYRGDSIFGHGPRVPLAKAQQRMVTAKLEAARIDRLITHGDVAIGRVLVELGGSHGAIHPTYATIAERAGCCVRTVGNALKRLRGIGLLDWARRMVRVGQRAAQTSNAYFWKPDAQLPDPPIKAARSKGKGCSQGPDSLSILLSLQDRTASLMALAARRAVVEALHRQNAEAAARGNNATRYLR